MTPGRDALRERFQDDASGTGLRARPAAVPARKAPTLAAYKRLVSIGVGVLIAAYVAAHVATIAISRLPWFDDTFFASIADSVRTYWTIQPGSRSALDR